MIPYKYFALVVCFFFMASCTSNPEFDQSKAHHTQSGFKNVYYEDEKGFLAFVKWRWDRLFEQIQSVDEYDFQIDSSQHDWVRGNTEKNTLTWIGHATFLLQLDGMNILTDPHFSKRASPVSWAGPKRAVDPAIEIDALPDIDAVVISHDHYDALDKDSILRLSGHNQARMLYFIVPLGMKLWFVDLGVDPDSVYELDWHQSQTINEFTFTAEPSQHWGKRSMFDAFSRLWASWVIESKGKKVFFAGDTGYAKHFDTIGKKYGEFDLALIPIGAYEPRWFMKSYHVNPDEAVQMHNDIRSKYSVAMHWGTFALTDEPLDEPPLALAQALVKYGVPKEEFQVYQHGQTQILDFPLKGSSKSIIKGQ
jgi:N-acyl-phosphatidylethanolamine-hydrolysing phospholipase D